MLHLVQFPEVSHSFPCLYLAVFFKNTNSHDSISTSPSRKPEGQLLRLLCLCRLPHGLVKHPHGNKDEPAGAGDADADKVRPGGRDLVRVRIFVVGHVADGHGALLLDGSQERPLVVDHEIENAVLIRDRKLDLVDALCLGRGALLRLKLKAVEGRKHTEFEL